jgi:hypothetical protein
MKIPPMTIAEFNERRDRAMEDSKNGRLTASSDIIIEIDTWG